jgi:Tfp pilus assembly protein PilV
MVGELLSTVGMKSGKRCRKNRARSERGSTLIETMVAVVLLIVIVGLLPVSLHLRGKRYTRGRGEARARAWATGGALRGVRGINAR